MLSFTDRSSNEKVVFFPLIILPYAVIALYNVISPQPEKFSFSIFTVTLFFNRYDNFAINLLVIVICIVCFVSSQIY